MVSYSEHQNFILNGIFASYSEGIGPTKNLSIEDCAHGSAGFVQMLKSNLTQELSSKVSTIKFVYPSLNLGSLRTTVPHLPKKKSNDFLATSSNHFHSSGLSDHFRASLGIVNTLAFMPKYFW